MKLEARLELQARFKLQARLKKFRRKVLQKTLHDLSNETGVNYKTISQFENYQSRNINHLRLYAEACEDELQFITLINLIKESLEEVRNEPTR